MSLVAGTQAHSCRAGPPHFSWVVGGSALRVRQGWAASRHPLPAGTGRTMVPRCTEQVSLGAGLHLCGHHRPPGFVGGGPRDPPRSRDTQRWACICPRSRAVLLGDRTRHLGPASPCVCRACGGRVWGSPVGRGCLQQYAGHPRLGRGALLPRGVTGEGRLSASAAEAAFGLASRPGPRGHGRARPRVSPRKYRRRTVGNVTGHLPGQPRGRGLGEGARPACPPDAPPLGGLCSPSKRPPCRQRPRG